MPVNNAYRKLKWFSLSFLLLVCLSAAVIFYFYRLPYILKSTSYYLKSGSSITKMAYDLEKTDIINNPEQLIVFARVMRKTSDLQAGEYYFQKGSSVQELLHQVVSGKVVYHTLPIIDGWNFKEMIAAVNADPLIKHTLKTKDPMKIMRKVDPLAKSYEGQFFPDTYKIARGITDVALLKKAHKEFKHHLNYAWEMRDKHTRYKSKQELLTVASLIERESSSTQERPVISGIILNRLKRKMPLQIDASVIYGMGEKYKGKIHHKDLRRDTPYNTYTRRGLPATPIAMCGDDALAAAGHPVYSDLLYFVSMNNGSHYFSSNLKTHNTKVRKYQLTHRSKKSTRSKHDG